MQRILMLATALFGVALAAPRGVTDKLASVDAAPAGCVETRNGTFEITVAEEPEKEGSTPEKEAVCDTAGGLVVTLRDGQIVDAEGRIGYIASNYQFQFDAPAQSGALITCGFSICEGNTLALGSSKTFFQCQSGDFYNLYDRTWAAQCSPAFLIAVPCTSTGTVSQTPSGQVVGTTAVPTTIVTALSDGQPQVVPTVLSVPVYSTAIPSSVSVVTSEEIQITSIPASELSMTMSVLFSDQSESMITTEVTATFAPLPTAGMTVEDITGTASIFSNNTATPLSSGIPEETQPATAAVSSSSAPTLSSASPASPSAPPTGGSSHVEGNSIGALVVCLLIALLCL